jgi:hypothetical protein
MDNNQYNRLQVTVLFILQHQKVQKRCLTGWSVSINYQIVASIKKIIKILQGRRAGPLKLALFEQVRSFFGLEIFLNMLKIIF